MSPGWWRAALTAVPARTAACSRAAAPQKKNPSSSSQVMQCRNSLNVILDISTDCASQWDSCRLSTGSGEGKCLLLGYILQGLDCQFSESKWWLLPLWGHPLAHSCARKRMRTRIKKNTRRGDAIAGNLKLFAWAGLWIKTFGIKKKGRVATLEMWVAKCCLPPLQRHVLLCF